MPTATLPANNISNVVRPTDHAKPACSRWPCMMRVKSHRSSSLAQSEMLLSVSSFSSRGLPSSRCSEKSSASASAPIRCSANQPIRTASPAAKNVVRKTRNEESAST